MGSVNSAVYQSGTAKNFREIVDFFIELDTNCPEKL